MKLKQTTNINVQEVLRTSSHFRFNCLCIGTAFRHDLHGLVVGGEDGIIRIYDMASQINTKSPKITLETKGGPIQRMAIHDVTKFYNDDLVITDSQGTVTVFCNQQILCRHSLAKDSIKCLQIHQDQFGGCGIITSDESGNICAVLPSKELWRININNLSIAKSPSQKMVIGSLLSTKLVTPHGEKCSYILAADDTQHLYLLHQGEVVMVINTPAVVTAMCSGLFVEGDKLESGPEAVGEKDRPQVALGCVTGAIYILHNFTITEEEFANSKYHITQLLTYPNPNTKIDYILCAGHFNALHVYNEGKKVGNFETPDWINSMDISCVEKDSKPKVVLGCSDNTIIGVTLQETG